MQPNKGLSFQEIVRHLIDSEISAKFTCFCYRKMASAGTRLYECAVALSAAQQEELDGFKNEVEFIFGTATWQYQAYPKRRKRQQLQKNWTKLNWNLLAVSL
jgi:hypothetical protein